MHPLKVSDETTCAQFRGAKVTEEGVEVSEEDGRPGVKDGRPGGKVKGRNVGS